jgi:hypothetical protein
VSDKSKGWSDGVGIGKMPCRELGELTDPKGKSHAGGETFPDVMKVLYFFDSWIQGLVLRHTDV